MSTLLQVIGGQRGLRFTFTGSENGATLKKISVWVDTWCIKSVKAWLTDGRSEQFGKPTGGSTDFEFQPGELFSSLSLWDNGDGTRLGAIKFTTTKNRDFFPKMTWWGLETEYKIDLGSGICLGIVGNSGDDIDCMGFQFISDVKSTFLKNVVYPPMSSVAPNVKMEQIFKGVIVNNTNVEQGQTIEFSKTLTTKSSWTVTNKMESTHSLKVSAEVPELVQIEYGYSFTLGTETSYNLEESMQVSRKDVMPVKVRPQTTVTVTGSIGSVVVGLPYKGTVVVTCKNGSVIAFPTSGVYNGLRHTETKTTLTETTAYA